MKRTVERQGMMRREVFTDFESADDMAEFLRAEWIGPERRWEEREALCLTILRRAKAGEKDLDFAVRFPEDSLPWLARAWLRAWRRAKRTREKGDIVGLMDACEEMGRLQERTFWRQGVDPETGARPEALALQARANRLALAADPDGLRASANAARREEAEEWREVAREVAASSRLRGQALEDRINKELARRGMEGRAGSTIRKAIPRNRGQ